MPRTTQHARTLNGLSTMLWRILPLTLLVGAGCQAGRPAMQPWSAAAQAMNPARLWANRNAPPPPTGEGTESELADASSALGETTDPSAANDPQSATGSETESSTIDFSERIAKVTEYGQSGSDKARKALTVGAKTGSDTLQNASQKAVATLGAKTGLGNVLEDPAWKERTRVAKLFVNEETAAKLDRGMQLLQDPSVEVQLQAVRTAGRSPLQVAGPIWLAALESKSPQVRAEAAKNLAANWQPAGEVWGSGKEGAVAALADPKHPQHAVALRQASQLKSRWDQEFGNKLGNVAKAGANYVKETFTEQQLETAQKLVETFNNAQLPQIVRQQAAEKLKLFGDQLPDLLHAVAERSGVPLSENIYRDLLAQASPVFGTLQKLQDGNPATRRLAVSELTKQVANRYLSDAELARLQTVAQGQQDPQIWSNLLSMVGNDKRERALQMAAAATLVPSEQVQAQAAQILSASGDPRYAAVLEALSKPQ